MTYNDVLTQLQLLIKTSAPPLLEVAKGPVEEPELVPGQRVTAFVLATQPNGRFQAQIGDYVLDMNLPKNTQPGENIELTFVSKQPRLTFVLSQDLAAAANTQTSAKAPVTLSDTARFLGALLQKVSEGQTAEHTSPLARTTPLVAAPPADVKEFANVLRSALTHSGLFYESHQAQWMNGQRPLADLLREPQGKLSPALQPPGVALPEDAKQATVSATASPAGSPAGVVATPHPAHPDTMPLVQQQLHALDAGQLVWQGQVWQGQTMEWTVEERPAHQNGEEAPPAWQTSLRLKLPRLGDVTATLAFVPQGLRINLRVAETGTGQLMKHAQGELRQSLETAGLPVLGMTVEKA